MKKYFIFDNNHVHNLPTNQEYNFNIISASFNFSGTSLQLMVALDSINDLDHDVIYEELKLDSPKFKLFSSLMCGVDCSDVVAVALEDLAVFSGTTKITKDKKRNKIHMIWESVKIFETPFNSANASTFEHDNSSNKVSSNKKREFFKEYDGDVVKSTEDSPFMILHNAHKCTLPTTLTYDFYIKKARFSPKCDSIQMIVCLENKEHNFRDTVYEEIPLKSAAFNKFVNTAYCGEWDAVIDFRPYRLSDFYGSVSLRQDENNVHVDWDTVEVNSTPMSSAGLLKLKWLERDEYRHYRN